MEAVSVPAQSVTLAAADLQAYIDAPPRLRTESLNIQVQAGHVPQTLRLEGFYGPGFLWIVGVGAENGGALDDGIVIRNCSNHIRVIGFDVRGSSVATGVSVSGSQSVSLENLTIDGNNFTDGSNGISADISCIVSAGSCTVSHFLRAIYTGAVMRLNDCGGSENTNGIAVEGGGIVLLSGSTPNLLGGAANNRWGGMIVKKDGALL